MYMYVYQSRETITHLIQAQKGLQESYKDILKQKPSQQIIDDLKKSQDLVGRLQLEQARISSSNSQAQLQIKNLKNIKEGLELKINALEAYQFGGPTISGQRTHMDTFQEYMDHVYAKLKKYPGVTSLMRNDVKAAIIDLEFVQRKSPRLPGDVFLNQISLIPYPVVSGIKPLFFSNIDYISLTSSSNGFRIYEEIFRETYEEIDQQNISDKYYTSNFKPGCFNNIARLLKMPDGKFKQLTYQARILEDRERIERGAKARFNFMKKDEAINQLIATIINQNITMLIFYGHSPEPAFINNYLQPNVPWPLEQFDVLKFVKRITPETAQKKKGDKLESKLNKVQK